MNRRTLLATFGTTTLAASFALAPASLAQTTADAPAETPLASVTETITAVSSDCTLEPGCATEVGESVPVTWTASIQTPEIPDDPSRDYFFFAVVTIPDTVQNAAVNAPGAFPLPDPVVPDGIKPTPGTTQYVVPLTPGTTTTFDVTGNVIAQAEPVDITISTSVEQFRCSSEGGGTGSFAGGVTQAPEEGTERPVEEDVDLQGVFQFCLHQGEVASQEDTITVKVCECPTVPGSLPLIPGSEEGSLEGSNAGSLAGSVPGSLAGSVPGSTVAGSSVLPLIVVPSLVLGSAVLGSSVAGSTPAGSSEPAPAPAPKPAPQPAPQEDTPAPAKPGDHPADHAGPDAKATAPAPAPAAQPAPAATPAAQAPTRGATLANSGVDGTIAAMILAVGLMAVAGGALMIRRRA